MIEKSNRQYIEEIKLIRRQMASLDQQKTELQDTIDRMKENEKFYRDLAENDPDWTFWLDADNRLVYVSPSAKRITGYEPEDFRKDAKLLFKMIHPDDRSAFDDHLHFARKSKASTEEEFRIIRKDKKTRWISHLPQPVYDEEGRYAGLLSSNRDITGSKTKNDGSLDSEIRYRLLSENIRDVVWSMDPTLRPTYVSPSVLLLLGYTVEEALDQNFRVVLTPVALQKFNEAWSPEMEKQGVAGTTAKSSLTLELECRRKDGSTVWTESQFTALRNDNKKIVEIICVSRDITALVEAREKLALEETRQAHSEQRMKALCDAAEESLYFADADGRLVLVNAAAARCLGTDPETLLASGKLGDFIPRDAEARCKEHIARALQGAETVAFQEDLLGRSMRCLANPVAGEDGTLIGVAVCGQDVTDLASARTEIEDLRRARDAAEKKRRDGEKELSERERQLDEVAEALKERQSLLAGCERRLAENSDRQEALEKELGDSRSRLEEKESALAQLKGELRGLLDAATEAFFLMDLQGRLLYANEATARLVHTELPAQTAGRSLYDFLPAPAADRYRKYAADVQKTGRPIHFDLEIFGRPMTHSVCPIMNEKGKVTRLAVFAADLSDRRTGEAQAEENRRRAREAEHMLQLIVDAIPLRIFWKDQNSVYRGANALFARDAGRENPEALIGKTDDDMIWSDKAKQYRREDSEVLTSGKPRVRSEERCAGPSGGQRCFQTTKTPLTDDGRIIGILGLYDDVTDRKTAEEALAESEKRYRSVFENNRMPMLLIDPEGGIILDANPAAADYYGWNRAALTRMTIADINTLPGSEITKMMKLAMTRKSSHVFFKHNLADGSVRDVEVFSSLLQFHGKAAICAMIYDVTERVRMEGALRQAEKLDSLGILAGGIAHDFNNLMTIVQGHIDVALLGLPEDDSARQSLRAAQDAVDKTREITGRLITFSRGGAPVAKPRRVQNLLSAAAQRLLAASPVKWSLDLADDLWPAEVDSNQIQQCFCHLIDNAREAMPEGGRLTIRVENADIGEADLLPLASGPYLKIIFDDSGAGIAPEHLARIFDPYFTTKPLGKEKGLGLGLAVCHSVLKKHDGYIAVHSDQGQGATFTLYLPAQPGAVVEEEPAQEKKPTPGRILIMDDNADIRKILQIYMEKQGFAVTGVTEGQEAVRQYREAQEAGEPYHAVFMEISVKQGLGGESTITRLKSIDPDVKAVAIVSEDGDSRTQNFLDLGFSEVLGKPFRLEDMRKILGSLIKI
ncbi:MAG: PAS domain S-box protein [Deltaproteobacteria bacterium]|nr:PAS domain S-box protein [Deltaproteobacteria bacterium]